MTGPVPCAVASVVQMPEIRDHTTKAEIELQIAWQCRHPRVTPCSVHRYVDLQCSLEWLHADQYLAIQTTRRAGSCPVWVLRPLSTTQAIHGTVANITCGLACERTQSSIHAVTGNVVETCVTSQMVSRQNCVELHRSHSLVIPGQAWLKHGFLILGGTRVGLNIARQYEGHSQTNAMACNDNERQSVHAYQQRPRHCRPCRNAW